jgi:hypothetical protein
MRSNELLSTSTTTSATRTLNAALLFTCLAAGTVFAQPAGGNGPRTPPAEALAACKSLTSDQACTFSGQLSTLTGTCAAPEGKPLACRPANANGPADAASSPKR